MPTTCCTLLLAFLLYVSFCNYFCLYWSISCPSVSFFNTLLIFFQLSFQLLLCNFPPSCILSSINLNVCPTSLMTSSATDSKDLYSFNFSCFQEARIHLLSDVAIQHATFIFVSLYATLSDFDPLPPPTFRFKYNLFTLDCDHVITPKLCMSFSSGLAL